MRDYITVNGGLRIPLDLIRSIRAIDADEQARISAAYKDIDGSQFHTKIEYDRDAVKDAAAMRLPSVVRETTEAIRSQVPMVNVGSMIFVQAYALTARELTDEDRAWIAARQENFGDDRQKTTYRSKVTTPGGTVWSTGTPDQIMDRRSKSLAAARSRDAANDAGAAAGAPRASNG